MGRVRRAAQLTLVTGWQWLWFGAKTAPAVGCRISISISTLDGPGPVEGMRSAALLELVALADGLADGFFETPQMDVLAGLGGIT